jgi:hypothetical protein
VILEVPMDETAIDVTQFDATFGDGPLEPISDEELTRLALAADPDAAVPHDALSLWEHLGVTAGTLLPAWYMPAPDGTVRAGRGWKRVAAVVAIAAFVGINASGLCSTYGWVGIG